MEWTLEYDADEYLEYQAEAIGLADLNETTLYLRLVFDLNRRSVVIVPSWDARGEKTITMESRWIDWAAARDLIGPDAEKADRLAPYVPEWQLKDAE